ncbi:MAG: hypothetical protein JWO94_2592 [Verrucomicrobiaceae bacterium]|nr:hypothetical protein [Verrucomicrobiaceae bacterium]
MSTILLLSKGLARYRHLFTEHFASALPPEVAVIACPYARDGALWEVDFPALKAAHGRVTYRDFPDTMEAVARMKPDLIGIMDYPVPMLRALAYGRRHKIPVIVFTEMGDGPPGQPVALRTRLVHKLMAHLTQGQVAHSPAATVPFGAGRRPVIFAPHSIDTTEFVPRSWPEPVGEQPCRLLCVAQYVERKGQDLLANALQRVKDAGLPFTLRLVGNNDDQSWVRRVIHEAGISEFTTITGPKLGAELRQEFQQADVFVLPSRFDTYGVVTQEAAASGLPLLISRHAGSAINLVREGQNGHVINPDNPACFAARLQEMMTYPQRWPAMGAVSRTLAESFCVRRIGSEVARWVQPLLKH